MNDDEANALARYLKAKREAAGLNISQLAKLVGVDHGYISRLERGEKRKPSAELLHKIANVLEVDPSEILSLIGVKPSEYLPPAPVYFRKKYGLSEADARAAAELIEKYITKEKEQPQ